MKSILEIGKKILKRHKSSRLYQIINFYQKATDDFIIEVARKEIKPKSRILDVGAGPLLYKTFFADCEYVTQDFKQYGQIDIISDAANIPVPDHSFDVVICTEVLEHVPLPHLVVKEISRILKPGGMVYITAPLFSGIHQAPYHFQGGLTKFWYLKFLEEYGFKDISITPKGGFFAFYGQYTMIAALIILKSKKWTSKIFAPLAALVMITLVPFFFWLDKKELEKTGSEYQITLGYLVKAQKNETNVNGDSC